MQTYQILTNNDEVFITSLSSILLAVMDETVFTPWQMKEIVHDLFRSITLKYFCTYYLILKPQVQLHIMRQNFLRIKLFQIR
jgi:hypothetical protein